VRRDTIPFLKSIVEVIEKDWVDIVRRDTIPFLKSIVEVIENEVLNNMQEDVAKCHGGCSSRRENCKRIK
jgi:hypothetical protein